MFCNGGLKSGQFRSTQTAYNDTIQTVLATGTDIAILGNKVCDIGNCIETDTGGFTFVGSGVYRIGYDVTFTATGAGNVILQLFKDVAALPCAIATDSMAIGDVMTIHVETTLFIPTCLISHPTIKLNVRGIAGTVTHVCAYATKLS